MCRNYNSNKRSILTTIIVAVICIVIVTGSTFSLFTSKTGTNIAINSGTVNMTAIIDSETLALYSMGARMGDNFANGGSASFNDEVTSITLDKMTPGDSVRFNIILTNSSTVDFKYRVTCTVDGKLAEALVSTANGDTVINGNSGWLTWDETGNTKTLEIEISFPEGLYGADYSQYDQYMNETATIDFKVEAVQANGVEQYEASLNPSIPEVSETVNAPETDANGKTVESVEIDLAEGGVAAVIPEGVKLADGAEALTFYVNEIEDSGANVEINDEEETKFSLDVHIDGIAADNTVPMAITLKEFLPVGLNAGNFSFYHVENDETISMRALEEGETPVHNSFIYDPATGDTILYLASFSEIAFKIAPAKWEGNFDYSWYKANATELYIANADQLAGFGAIVGGMNGRTRDSFEGKTVKLLSNINIGDLDSENKVVFYPIGYYNNTGSYVQLGLLLQGNL